MPLSSRASLFRKMSKKEKSSSIPMGLIGILRESIKIPLQNLNLSLSLGLLRFIPFFILFFFNDILLQPVVTDLTLKAVTLQTTDPQSPEYLKLLDGIKEDVRVVFGDLAIYLFFSFLTTFVVSVTTIYAWAAAYLGKGLSLGELFPAAWRRWKRPVITQLYITLISTGYIIVASASISAFAFLAKLWAPLLALVFIIGVLAIVFYVYHLTVTWKMGFVISVVDEELYGLGALRKAGELLKGRRRQGYRLYLVLSLPYMLMGLLQNKISMQPEAVRLAVGTATILVGSLLFLFVEAASTVFYYDCRKSQGEVVELQGNFGYTTVPTTTHVDGDVP